MKAIRKVGVARDLTLWLVAGCLMLITPILGLVYHRVISRAEAELRHEAETLCTKLASVLHKHIWELDDTSIQDYFNAYCVPGHLIYVRIVTQYGDPIYTYGVPQASRAQSHRCVLSNSDEEIGAVEVGLSRATIERYRTYMATLMLGMAALLTLALATLSAILIHLLLGRPLNLLILQLRAVADGKYASRVPPHRYREVDEINKEVNQMAERIAQSTAALQAEIDERKRAEDALQHMNSNLEQLVGHRTAQIREVNEKLRQESDRRKRVQRDILEISNREQRRIGQDLHDSVCQELAGISYLTASLELNLAAKGYPDAALARRIAALLRESVSHTRRVAKGLNPVGLEADGLTQELKAIAEDTGKMFHIDCRVTCVGDGYIHENGVAIHLIHITREAIHNALRHGKATRIDIRLVTEGEAGSLVISDNGDGFSTTQPPAGGMGLHTMMYRAELIAGELTIQSAVHAGATVTVTFKNRGVHADGNRHLFAAQRDEQTDTLR